MITTPQEPKRVRFMIEGEVIIPGQRTGPPPADIGFLPWSSSGGSGGKGFSKKPACNPSSPLRPQPPEMQNIPTGLPPANSKGRILSPQEGRNNGTGKNKSNRYR